MIPITEDELGEKNVFFYNEEQDKWFRIGFKNLSDKEVEQLARKIIRETDSIIVDSTDIPNEVWEVIE